MDAHRHRQVLQSSSYANANSQNMPKHAKTCHRNVHACQCTKLSRFVKNSVHAKVSSKPNSKALASNSRATCEHLLAAYERLASCRPAALRATYELQTGSIRATCEQLASPPRPRANSANSVRKRPSLPKWLRSTTARSPAASSPLRLETAREPLARPQTASEAARAQFAITLEPLRLRAVRFPALKIDRLSKFRILAYARNKPCTARVGS